MNSYCYYHIDFPTDGALKLENPIFNKQSDEYSIKQIYNNFDQYFNTDWILEFTKKIGVISHVMIFTRKEYSTSKTAHIDVKTNGTPNWFGLNWIVSGANSEMVWYELPRKSKKLEIFYTEANTPYTQIPINKLKVIERYKITDKMVMTRTDVPHSIVVGDEFRIAVSIRTRFSLEEHSSWKKSVSFFRKNKLLIDRP